MFNKAPSGQFATAIICCLHMTEPINIFGFDFRQGQGHYPKLINCSQRSGIVGVATNVAYFQARLRNMGSDRVDFFGIPSGTFGLPPRGRRRPSGPRAAPRFSGADHVASLNLRARRTSI
jgi:hypothetical protein